MKNEKLTELFHSLTLSEKLGQMTQVAPMLFDDTGSITGPIADLGLSEEDKWKVGTILGGAGASSIKKLQEEYLKNNEKKIPLIFMSDVIHGYKTTFPVPLALGCSWDVSTAYTTARVSAIEAAVAGLHVTFSPMVDLVRDPRWGRVVETTGEDPYLNSLFAKSFVYGYQIEHDEDSLEMPGSLSSFEGKDSLGRNTLAACAKHFAGYGASEAGRDYNTVDISPLQLKQFYLPAYFACVEAGCELVMTAFNIIDGVPCAANQKLIRDILRKEWKFDGVVISDWGAVKELIPHGLAGNDKEAALLSLKGGVDIEMMTSTYYKNLEEAVSEDPELLELIDQAVWQILKLKNKLQLFEYPYRFADGEKEQTLLMCEKHRKAARETAAKSIVLLQNNGALPIAKSKKIALIGPFASNNDVLGPWSLCGDPEDAINLETGLRTAGYELTVVHSGNSPIPADAQEADVIVLALGEDSIQSGEGGSVADITLPEEQVKLLKEAKKLGKPVVMVMFNGRPLVLTDLLQYPDAILEAWYLGTETGNAIADVLSGLVNPSGRLTMSFPYAVGQIPIYYNSFRTGRPVSQLIGEDRFTSHFLDIPNEPLFPFGFGLSYTTFEYGNCQLSDDIMKECPLRVSVNVKNTGTVTGIETVQFYLQDVSAQVVRPEKQLIHYQQITLQPGEDKTVSFELTEEQLKYYNGQLEYVSDAGKFIVMAGSNSLDVTTTEFYYQK